jgi:hypothetical protein
MINGALARGVRVSHDYVFCLLSGMGVVFPTFRHIERANDLHVML